MLVFRGPVLLDLDQETVEHGLAELHVRHLAAAEADDGLDLVPVLEEADHVVLLEVEVVLVDAGAELHLLDDDHLLLLLGLGLLLLLLEEELAVIHDLADRRIRRRRDLHEVEVLLPGHLVGLGDGDDSNLLSLGIDQAHLGVADQVIDAVFGLRRTAVETWITAWWKNTEVPPRFLGRSIYGQRVRAVKSTSRRGSQAHSLTGSQSHKFRVSMSQGLKVSKSQGLKVSKRSGAPLRL